MVIKGVFMSNEFEEARMQGFSNTAAKILSDLNDRAKPRAKKEAQTPPNAIPKGLPKNDEEAKNYKPDNTPNPEDPTPGHPVPAFKDGRGKKIMMPDGSIMITN